MVAVSQRAQGSFEWRVHTGSWRWVILGALGMTPSGCGGRANGGDGEASGVNAEGKGGTSSGTSSPDTATGGDAGFTSIGGSAMVGSAGAGGADGSSAGTGGSATTTTPSRCEPPLTDLGGGWERCGNGMVHRPQLGSCASSVPRPEPTVNPYPPRFENQDAGVGTCRRDSDCTEKPYGHCEYSPYLTFSYCDYGCVTNADCEPGFACFCGEPVGACMVADCAIDADCGPGFLCADYTYAPGCGGQRMACQNATDACAVAGDCGESQYCARGSFDALPAPDAPRYCSPTICDVGRPFLIAGQARLAREVARGDWYPAARNQTALAKVDDELASVIRRGWVAQALMEHASVAAFARFSLQLLALGAPAELLARSASAMGDEIEHARACFELARRHGEGEVGPGPLDLSGALESTDLEAVLVGTIAEGCIGETVAAIEAAEACAHCEDDVARSVLERIARDETQHAELAWRFVAWALQTGPTELRQIARAAFAAATDEADPATAAPSRLDRELARHGLIGASLRQELRARVLRDVIAPCARALLEPPEKAFVARAQAPEVMHGSATLA